MPLNEFGRKVIANFIAAIEPWKSGYEKNSFAYLAVKRDGRFVISQGTLWLNSIDSKIPFQCFETENVCAEHYKLTDVDRTVGQCIEDLCEGKIITPRGDRYFDGDPVEGHKALFTPIHPTALQSQSRVNVLRLTGDRQGLHGGPSILDWELRSSDTPYDTVQELSRDYGLGGLFTDELSVEVIATSVMGFDGDNCIISNETAKIVVKLANKLDVNKADIGFREIKPNQIKRGKLRGSQFQWTKTETMQLGALEMPVEKAAILHCYALYNNVTQTHWYISDPRTSQNARRVVFESFDTGCTILSEFLSRSRTKGQDARDLEIGVAWLCWMLGFNPIQMGSTARTQDFSDLILATPQGQLVIVECTTGLLRADSKLSKLIARAAVVRMRLDQSNNQHLKLLPVMVSTLTKDELQADLEQAERLGVGVLTREDLDDLIKGTIIARNADELFAAAERSIEEKRTKSNSSEPELPLSQ
jgi:hypothetical protein